MQATNDDIEDESNHTTAEIVHIPEPTENNVFVMGLTIYIIKSLKLRIRCCAVMCKLKQGRIIMNQKNSFKCFLRKLRQVGSKSQIRA